MFLEVFKLVFTDNVGLIFAGLMRAPVIAVTSIAVLKDVSGNVANFRVITNSTFNVFSDPVKIQVGKGSTPANPQDFQIEEAFLLPPESDLKLMTASVFVANSNEIVQNANINNVQGSGTIAEVITTTRGSDTGNALHTFMLTRNNVNPVIPFIATENINMETKVTF
jgi:hypothetical protein